MGYVWSACSPVPKAVPLWYTSNPVIKLSCSKAADWLAPYWMFHMPEKVITPKNNLTVQSQFVHSHSNKSSLYASIHTNIYKTNTNGKSLFF